MKKRILALALAGTTAFSVFGAAMSANAADLTWQDIMDFFADQGWVVDGSSHTGAGDGAEYHSYDAAGKLYWGVSTTGSNYADIGEGFLYAMAPEEFEQMRVTPAAGKIVLDPDKVITVSWGDQSYGDAAQYIDKYTDYTSRPNGVIDGVGYYESYADFAKAAGYTTYTIMDGGYGQVDTDNDGEAELIIARANDGSYHVFTKTYWDKNYGSDSNYKDDSTESGYSNGVVTAGTNYYVKGSISENTTVYTIDAVKEDYLRYVADYYAIETKDIMAFAELDTNMAYVVRGDVGGYCVYTGKGVTNSTLVEEDGTPVTDLVSGLDTIEEVMEYEIDPDGEIYTFDYILPLEEDDFADYWEDDTLVSVLSRVLNANFGYINPELGTYNVSNIRDDVIYAWEDFLDEIGISDLTDYGLTRWAKATLENYVYEYTDDFTITIGTVVNGRYSIQVTTNEDIDLYNFETLIEDIMYRAPSARAENAQTSELVYLMQQYYKYTEGGYVDVKPVETDDWGDLLVALAQAPTEDEFSTAAAYRRYTNKVEDLVEQYMEAETSAAVDMAEAELYGFVTDYFSTYRYAAKADTTVLENAIDKLFFNYDWEEDYKIEGKDYPAEAYPGAVDKDGDLDDRNPVDPYDYGDATYAMYPGKDYGDSTNKVKNYPGVNDYIDYSGLNSSYFWFANVYTLAYNVYQNNEYQSVIDLMAETLNEAVDNLSVNSLMNARASDILGAEEANEKLDARIETDYTAAMWNDLSKVNSFITDRVSAKEIGETGTNNAEKIAELVESAAKLQRNQSVVTRSEIDGTAGVKTALKNAQTTLAALEKDDDNYNAAQATALKNAINDCQEIIDLYNGNYSTSKYSQSVNGEYDGKVGDKDQILKSDITGAIQAVEDAINFKNIIQGWTKTENGWKYGVEDTYDSALTWGVEDTLEGPHYLNFGWAKIGNTWFYFDDEGIAKESDWLQVGNDWYYFNKNCGAAIGWAKVDDQWYYFNQGCKMMTGWQKVDGNWYYLKPSGAMATGWCQVDGKWYYLSTASNSLGQMYYSTTTPDGYKVDASGALVE